MAGGSGTRFWPESTKKKPKQYLNLLTNHSLLFETLNRLDGLITAKNRFIVTTKDQKDLALESSKEMIHPDKGIILEPQGRNTAPCLLLALAHLKELGADDQDCVAVLPADHVILDQVKFKEVLNKAILAAKNYKKILTIGINPGFPHTGFGYIKKGSQEEPDLYQVDSFVEKPNQETAEKYVASQNYYWNAGMFVSTIGVLLEEFYEFYLTSTESFSHLRKAVQDHSFENLQKIYSSLNATSIDYAIMEKSQKVMAIKGDFGWSDLGSWDALEGLCPAEKKNTLLFHSGSYVNNAKGNIVFAPEKFVSLVDIDDLIVVSNKDHLLVLPKNKAQKVKEIVAALEKEGQKDLL